MIIKKKLPILLVIVFTMAMAMFIAYRPVVFQRGNPIPYITKMIDLNGNTHFSKVFNDKEIYITKRYDIDGINKHIEDIYDVSYIEQMGSAYIFKSADKTVIAETELYWKYYQIWELSEHLN